MKKETCSKCKQQFDSAYPLYNQHTEDDCMMGEIVFLKQENAKLKASVESWKVAWYDIRERLGKLWWHHPALYCDKALAYYRDNLKKIS